MVANTRCPQSERNRVFYEAPNRANGCNSVKFVKESVTVKEAKNVRNTPDEQIVIFQKGYGNVVDIIFVLGAFSRYEVIAGSEEE